MPKEKWTLWQNGKAKQKKAAKEMAFRYRWESDRKGSTMVLVTPLERIGILI